MTDEHKKKTVKVKVDQRIIDSIPDDMSLPTFITLGFAHYMKDHWGVDVLTERKEAKPPVPAPKQYRINYDWERHCFTGITDSDIAGWSEKFPHLNIRLEINRAAEWMSTRPRNKYKDFQRFLGSNWLGNSASRNQGEDDSHRWKK